MSDFQFLTELLNITTNKITLISIGNIKLKYEGMYMGTALM